MPELLEDAKGKAGESDDDEAERREEDDGEEEEEEQGPQDADSLARAVADAFRELIAINLKMGLIDRAALAEKWKVVDTEKGKRKNGGGENENGDSLSSSPKEKTF